MEGHWDKIPGKAAWTRRCASQETGQAPTQARIGFAGRFDEHRYHGVYFKPRRQNGGGIPPAGALELSGVRHL